jgi:hypothetical protein
MIMALGRRPYGSRMPPSYGRLAKMVLLMVVLRGDPLLTAAAFVAVKEAVAS